MKECQGFFGKHFGHKYKSMTVKITPPRPKLLCNMKGCSQDVMAALMQLSTREYKIVCQRCGHQL